MRILSLMMALIIAAGLWYWFVLRHDTQAPEAIAASVEQEAPAAQLSTAAPEMPVPVQILPSRAQKTVSTVVLRGQTKAVRDVSVQAETAGRVISLPLRRGAHVAKGQVLCELDPGVRQASLAEAEAALTEAAAEASAAVQLQSKGYTAETTLKARQARLRAAQARLDTVRLDIERLKIVAPFDGMLESDTAELGKLLRVGDMCADVIDLTQVTVTGYVGEQQVDRLRIGQPASATLITGRTADGEISFLSRMADVQTRTYEVEVTLKNPDGQIRGGMTTELSIALPDVKAHLVPQSALTLDDSGRLGLRLDVDGVAPFSRGGHHRG